MTKIIKENPIVTDMEYLSGLLLRRQNGLVCLSDAHSQSFGRFGKARKWRAKSPEKWLVQRRSAINDICLSLYQDGQSDKVVVRQLVATKHGLKNLVLVPKELAADYLLWLCSEIKVEHYRSLREKFI